MSRKDRERGFVSRNMSTESTSSAGGGEIPSRMAGSGLKGPEDLTTNLFDCCVLLLHCPRHNRFALKKINKAKGLWLPFIAISASDSWIQSINAKTKQLLTPPGKAKAVPHTAPEPLHYTRVQLPFTSHFVNRVTFFSKLDPPANGNSNSSPCCDSLGNKELVWLSSEDLQDVNRCDFWGPEPGVYVNAFISKDGSPEKLLSEYTLRDIKKHIPKPVKGSAPPSVQEELVKIAKFSEKDCLSVYSDFVQQCFPSVYMVLSSFVDLFKKKGWTGHESDLIHLYRSFRVENESYLTFSELLLGLAAMDKNTPQSGSVGDLRAAYIFRFYDFDGDSKLNYSEMGRLGLDMLRIKNKPHDVPSVEKEVNSNYSAFKVKTKDLVDWDRFKHGFGKMDNRVTSVLFRSPLSGSALLRPCFPSITDLQSQTDIKTGKSRGCFRCREKKYYLATYSVRLNEAGTIDWPQDVEQEYGKSNKQARNRSKAYFDKDNVANIALDMVKDHADAESILKSLTANRSKRKSNNIWGPAGWRTLLRLCDDVSVIFKREPRVVKVSSPCVVLGDINGNLHDLLIFERLLWKRGPACEAANYLFLGDYVDKGPNGIECIMYLFAMKILSPDKFTLLRGNHELRSVQKKNGFEQEVSSRFGSKDGPKMWEIINRVFDCMPLAAVIDDSIFCGHAGIPASTSKLEELQKIPVPLSDPDKESPYAWEILFNDPISATEFANHEANLKQQSGKEFPGFVFNRTGYFFSDKAVDNFLDANGLSHIIRSHEPLSSGYGFHSKGRVVTIFSSSKCEGGTNEAACALVDQEKVRILRLVTSAQ